MARAIKMNHTNLTDLYFDESYPGFFECTLRDFDHSGHLFVATGSTCKPYVLINFPSGNCGCGIWFEQAELKVISQLRPCTISQKLKGLEVDFKILQKSLCIEDALATSTVFLRDRELREKHTKVPQEIRTAQYILFNRKLTLTQTTLTQLGQNQLEILCLGDTDLCFENDIYILKSENGSIEFTLRALTSEPILTPLSINQIFKSDYLDHILAGPHVDLFRSITYPKAVQGFMFLMTKEKFMAGSPRYHSLFARDGLYILHVLFEALQPDVIENFLTALLEGANFETGQVSHEKLETDYAAYQLAKSKRPYIHSAVFLENYVMKDDEFAFVVVLEQFLSRHPEHAMRFLTKNIQGHRLSEILKKIFSYILTSAERFVKDPQFSNLIRIEIGHDAGNWRDSDAGLGRGVYPFDVNAAFMPAALAALIKIFKTPTFQTLFDCSLLVVAQKSFEIWNQKVPKFFEVEVAAQEAFIAQKKYCTFLNLPFEGRCAQKDIFFPALSLLSDGRKVGVMHSDDSLMLSFGYPSDDYLNKMFDRIEDLFPVGLNIDRGITVTNPVFETALWKDFGGDRYHGFVSWTSQEQLLSFGIRRHLKRTDLDPSIRMRLEKLKSRVQTWLDQRRSLSGNELFAIHFDQQKNEFELFPFNGDAVSNINQGWSHMGIVTPEIAPWHY